MSMKDDGGPAFPQTIRVPDEFHAGMSLRDWFAGQALQGMLANGERRQSYAAEAYSLADAMLAERKQ